MNKFGQGLFVGVLITLVLISSVALAVDNPIKLIINGQEIKPDIEPQLINGRVLVPARFVAEALGAKVDWDQENKAVVITSVEKEVVKEPDIKDDLISAKDLAANHGISITILDSSLGGIVRLSAGEKSIDTKDYKIVGNKMYFKKDILTKLGL